MKVESCNNIMLVCSSLGGGGAERVATNLALEFLNIGIRVSIFFWDDKTNSEYFLDKRIVLYRPQSRNFFFRCLSMRKALIKENPEAVISFTDIPNIITWLASLLMRGSFKRLPTIHSNLRARDLATGYTIRNQIVRFLHRLSCRRAFGVVAVSDGVRKAAAQYLSLNDRTVVTIYNPIFSGGLMPAAAKKEVDRRHIKLVAAGRLSAAKDYPVMFRAVNILISDMGQKCSLDIYGEGPLEKDLKDLAKEMSLQDAVQFKGFSKNLKENFPRYDMLVLSSRWEGFANVLVEALLCKLPVISTNCPSGPSEVLDNGRFGTLVPVSDPVSLAEGIYQRVSKAEKQFNDDDLAKHLSKFSSSYVAKQYLDYLSGCCL
ncbi:glycosyltransferase [Alloalcanivorax mobilis]|uniref:glycosyltransferase n=1 Tax=Alloalcanivorax mobilis TaxID=2019569 RepID=UPI000C76BE45|nr:glycosyltransferase [Alloalcanivorax mobilis]